MRFALRAVPLTLALVLATNVPIRGQSTAEGELEQLLARATWYSIDFVNKLSQVVAEERYIQDSSVALATVPLPVMGGRGGSPLNSAPRGTSKHRELKADFLIVRSSHEMWSPFRDVFEVDHIPVRDREERLAKLFLGNKVASNDENARAIAEESARYNLGAVQRTINNPVFALMFLQPDVRTRFKFTPGKADIEGVPYGGGRADVRVCVGGDGELYILSKADGMVRKVTALVTPPPSSSAQK